MTLPSESPDLPERNGTFDPVVVPVIENVQVTVR
jgi:hypothetical protein